MGKPDAAVLPVTPRRLQARRFRSGGDIEYLIDLAVAAGGVELRVVVDWPLSLPREVIAELRSGAIREFLARSWPGSEADDDHLVIVRSVDAGSRALLARELLSWLHGEGAVSPFDPHIVRADGSVVLDSTICTGDLWVEVPEGFTAPRRFDARLGLTAHPLPAHESPAAPDATMRIKVDRDGAESLWCRPVEGGFEIASIPFADCGVALADVVAAVDVGEGLTVGHVLRRSGRGVLDLFGFPFHDLSQELLLDLSRSGFRWELVDSGHAVIDFASESHLDLLLDIVRSDSEEARAETLIRE